MEAARAHLAEAGEGGGERQRRVSKRTRSVRCAPHTRVMGGGSGSVVRQVTIGVGTSWVLWSIYICRFFLAQRVRVLAPIVAAARRGGGPGNAWPPWQLRR